MNEKLIAQATRDLIIGLGYDPDDEALKDTPSRVARAWSELLAGVKLTPEQVVTTSFAAAHYDEVVVLRDIPFYSMCEHHLLPFFGTAAVAYLPGNGRVVGLSKLARLVEMHARRLQLQERMTQDIAGDLGRVVSPRGVAVIVKAQHLCMCSRGVEKPGAEMVTSTMTGCFRESHSARAEVLELMR